MDVKGKLANIVGPEWAKDDEDTLSAYSEDLSFVPPGRPDCVVRPRDAKEVQAIVRWANETHTPLMPVSSGPPRFRGDTIPGSGGVVIDLIRMNKVIRVNRRNRVVMIEPGVTFAQIQEEVGNVGMRVTTPLLPRRTKSVIASFLEREPIMIPRYHWDISDPLCCVEVVFGSGDLFRTGEAAGPGTIEEQWRAGGAQKFPLGPHQVDYHRIIQGAQGTMGIVTWASVKCEISPQIQKLFLVPSESFEELIGFMYKLLKLDIGEEILALNSLNLAGILADEPDTIEELRASLPKWVLIFCIAGFERAPADRVAYQERDMMDIAGQFDLKPASVLNGIRNEEVLEALGRPSGKPYWKLKFKGGCHDIFFITTLDKVPRFIKIMQEAAERADYPTTNIGAYIQPIVQGTSCHLEFDLTCDPDNVDEMNKVKEILETAVGALINEGAFFSRPYGSWADVVYRDDTEYVKVLRKVKEIFDPKNVMNPGRLCF